MQKSKYNAFVENLMKHVHDGFIKVHFTIDASDGGPSGENVWAKLIGPNMKYAKLANIPTFVEESISSDDIVEVEWVGGIMYNYVRLINRGSYRTMVKLTVTLSETTMVQTQEVHKHFIDHKVWYEPIGGDLLIVAIPATLSFAEACKFMDNIPHMQSHSLQDADESEFDIDVDSIPEE